MHEIKITIRNTNPLVLCEIFNKYKSDFDLHSQRAAIDGKSFLGIHTLNPNEPILLKIIEKDDELENILKDLEDFII